MTERRPLPFFDLTRQYQTIETEIMEALLPLLRSQQFVLGPSVQHFEEKFARNGHVSHAVGVASGTDALLLSLVASGLESGGGVIVPSFTFFASASAISLAGGRPVFIDVDPDSFLLTPRILEDFMKEQTVRNKEGIPVLRKDGTPLVGVMPVHLYGQMVEMEGVSRVASGHGLWVVEDACQAVGATCHGRPPGIHGNAAAYSFFPTKNLGGFGDGGLVTTENGSFAAHLKRLRVHGSEKRYEHVEMGYNSRLDALQAAVLSVKLDRLGGWTKRRQELASAYDAAFGRMAGVSIPRPIPGRTHVYHQYTLRIEGEGRRDRLRAFLQERGIGSEVYYHIPLHRQKAFEKIASTSAPLPVSERLSGEVLSLPVFPELTAGEQERIITAVLECLS